MINIGEILREGTRALSLISLIYLIDIDPAYPESGATIDEFFFVYIIRSALPKTNLAILRNLRRYKKRNPSFPHK